MTAALEGGEWSAARPSRTLPPGKTWYPFYRRLGGPQDRSGRAENLVPTGIRSRIVQPVVSRYIDWATRPTSCLKYNIKYKYSISPPLSLRLNATPNFTAIVTGHGNIKSYLYKYRIIDNPMCPCVKGDQTVDHILFDCTLLEQERDKLKAVVTRTENWPASYNKLNLLTPNDVYSGRTTPLTSKCCILYIYSTNIGT